MVLERGDKLLIVHRKLFEGDATRFFAGRVEAYGDGLARVAGHTWTWDPYSREILRKEGLRRKIIALGSGTFIVYQLDPDTHMEGIAFRCETDGSIWITDGGRLSLDISDRVRKWT
jgi:hypothetical protein